MPLSMRASPIWSLDHETDDKPAIIIVWLSMLRVVVAVVMICIECSIWSSSSINFLTNETVIDEIDGY